MSSVFLELPGLGQLQMDCYCEAGRKVSVSRFTPDSSAPRVIQSLLLQSHQDLFFLMQLMSYSILPSFESYLRRNVCSTSGFPPPARSSQLSFKSQLPERKSNSTGSNAFWLTFPLPFLQNTTTEQTTTCHNKNAVWCVPLTALCHHLKIL